MGIALRAVLVRRRHAHNGEYSQLGLPQMDY